MKAVLSRRVSRNAFFVILSVYILTPVVLIAFNFAADPHYHYRTPISPKTFQTLISSQDQLLLVPDNYNDRLFIKQALLAIPAPRVLIMGGSRIMAIQGDAFTISGVVNAGVTASCLRDTAALWQMIKEANKKPEWIILALEPQSIYSTSLEAQEWYTLWDSFYRFFLSHQPDLKNSPLAYKTLIKRIAAEFELLTSTESMFNQRSFKPAFQLVERNLRPLNRPARTPSLGTLLPAQTQNQEWVDYWGRENGKGEAPKLENWSGFEESTFHELQTLLLDMRSQNVQVLVLLMPSHPLSYEEIRKNPGTNQNLIVFADRIKKIAAQSKILFYDALHENMSFFKNSDFIDGVHLRKEALDRLLEMAANQTKVTFIKRTPASAVISDTKNT